jgi:DNA-binding CsgD family transcriptional regulator
MGRVNIARLSPRQRDCLALVADHKSSKEIAGILGLSSKTVDGYLAEAVELLDARNRRHAAQIYQEVSRAMDPGESPKDSLRVDDGAYVIDDRAGKRDHVLARPAGTFTYGSDASVEKISGPANSRFGFSILRGERRGNDLTTRQRLIWMLMASVAAMLLFSNAVIAISQLAQFARSLMAIEASGRK